MAKAVNVCLTPIFGKVNELEHGLNDIDVMLTPTVNAPSSRADLETLLKEDTKVKVAG